MDPLVPNQMRYRAALHSDDALLSGVTAGNRTQVSGITTHVSTIEIRPHLKALLPRFVRHPAILVRIAPRLSEPILLSRLRFPPLSRVTTRLLWTSSPRLSADRNLHQTPIELSRGKVVLPVGVEPTTSRLSSGCSNQLSYDSIPKNKDQKRSVECTQRTSLRLSGQMTLGQPVCPPVSLYISRYRV